MYNHKPSAKAGQLHSVGIAARLRAKIKRRPLLQDLVPEVDSIGNVFRKQYVWPRPFAWPHRPIRTVP